RLALGSFDFRLLQLRGDGADDACRHLVLQFEDICGARLETFGPKMHTGGSIDQLAVDAHAVRDLAHAAFEQVAHAEFTPDFFHIDAAPFVDEARVARDHE